MESMLDKLAGPPTPPSAKTMIATPANRAQRTAHGVMVIPYNATFDPHGDQSLPFYWQQLKADGLVSLYYPGAEDTGFADFVKMMSGGARILMAVTKDADGNPADWLGFISWEPMALGTKHTAVAGFIFLKRYWDHRYSTDAGNAAMRYWFTETDMDVAIGIVASTNILAQRFLKRLGWMQNGMIPEAHVYDGKPCDAQLWTMTKAQFMVGES